MKIAVAGVTELRLLGRSPTFKVTPGTVGKEIVLKRNGVVLPRSHDITVRVGEQVSIQIIILKFQFKDLIF